MTASRLRVALHVGQLLHTAPGGIGRYVDRLLEHLPGADVDVVPFSAGRPDPAPPGHVDLGWPHGAWRYELWHVLRRPRLGLRADVVHATSLAVPPTGHVPMVVTVHDLAFLERADFHTGRGHRFHVRGFDLARREAAVFLAPSQFVAQQLAAHEVDPGRIVVAPHGVDPAASVTDEECDRTLSAFEIEPPFLLHVGTAEVRKGTDTLLAALPVARERHPDLDLVLVSPGGWGRVDPVPGARALGGVADIELEALYRKASALVYPSRHEGFGMPVLEAMVRGCPVITSRASSLPEVAGDAAVLVDPDDAGALAAAITSVLSDAELRRHLAEAGLDRAAQFTWKASAEAHATAYRLALAQDDGAEHE